MYKGYNDENSQDYCTFCTLTLNYKWKVPFGLKAAGATYTSLLKMVLKVHETLKISLMMLFDIVMVLTAI